MKGGETFLILLLIIVIAILGYYNYSQQKTINLLNEEVFEQARLRHEIVLEKYQLELQINTLQKDTLSS
jgi:hypothetical protein